MIFEPSETRLTDTLGDAWINDSMTQRRHSLVRAALQATAEPDAVTARVPVHGNG